MEDTQNKPWLYKLRSSESFVILVVSIAIFTVSGTPTTHVEALLTFRLGHLHLWHGMSALALSAQQAPGS